MIFSGWNCSATARAKRRITRIGTPAPQYSSAGAAADELGGPADIVVANILAQPLIVLAPLLASLTVPGGRIALSGILEEQSDDVRETYRAWYDFEPVQDEDGWVLISGVRKPKRNR